jgi:DNA repair exonuclease SbcCD ATPase subunit
MRVIFTHIEIEGFRSIVKPFRFQFDQPGIILVRGLNGAGKTTAFEGLVWALFGTNLKDTVKDRLPSWPEVRQSDWKGTRVCLSMLVDGKAYTIARHLNYKSETFEVKGEDHLIVVKGDDDHGEKVEMIGDYKNKELTQEFINKLIGVDANTFMNSIMFGQRMAKLVEQDNGDKRKLFEVLFETEWVNQAKAICDDKLKKAQAQLLITDANIISTQRIIEEKKTALLTTEQFLQGFEEGRKFRKEVKERERIRFKTQFDDAHKEQVKLLNEQAKLKYDSKLHDTAEAALTSLEAKLADANKSIVLRDNRIKLAEQTVATKEGLIIIAQANVDRLKAKHIEEKCPYCAQELLPGNQLEVNHNTELTEADTALKAAKIAKEAVKDVLDKEKAVTIPKPVELQKDIDKANDALAVLDGLYTQFTEFQTKIDAQSAIKVQADKDITRIDNEITFIGLEVPPATDIPGMKKAIEDEKATLAQLQVDQPKYKKEVELATWWSGKGFSSGGIKAFIFKAMLSQLNENVKKYGQRLGASLEFSIDLTKASKPFTTVCSLGDKINKEYKEFSGGEKQRLDICLMFAMYDLISMGTNYNLLIMDEALENLDEDGGASAFDIIRQIAAEGKVIYLITHSATVDTLFSKSIIIDKDRNGSTIVIE